jgi:hypothetical protein
MRTSYPHLTEADFKNRTKHHEKRHSKAHCDRQITSHPERKVLPDHASFDHGAHQASPIMVLNVTKILFEALLSRQGKGRDGVAASPTG